VAGSLAGVAVPEGTSAKTGIVGGGKGFNATCGFEKRITNRPIIDKDDRITRPVSKFQVISRRRCLARRFIRLSISS
jgi:hypothetical protein